MLNIQKSPRAGALKLVCYGFSYLRRNPSSSALTGSFITLFSESTMRTTPVR